MTTVHLSKLHATGNDFLVALALDSGAPVVSPAATIALCNRHTGIGADGLITIEPGANGSDCTMVLLNADGGRAEMSGNGIRALARVAAGAGLGSGDEFVVDTDGGRRVVTLTRDADKAVVAADVDMGAVTILDTDVSITVHGAEYRGDTASVGNPHFVCFVDDPLSTHVTTHGPIIERNERFPNRTNVEFVAVSRTDALTIRVWERGAGETQSCGTGACASAAVAHARGLVGTDVEVAVPGGVLQVVLGPTVRLGGPVVHVFDVDVEIA